MAWLDVIFVDVVFYMVVVMVILQAFYSRTHRCFCSKSLVLVAAALILAGLEFVPGEAGTLSAADSGQGTGRTAKGDKSGPGGALGDSLAFVERKLKVNPYDVDALGQKARLLMNMHRPKEALAVIDIAIKREPTLAKLYKLRAEINEDLKNPTAMLSDLNKAIDLDPRNGELYADRARVYFVLDGFGLESGDSGGGSGPGGSNKLWSYEERGLADLDKALKLSPKSAKINFFRSTWCLTKDKPKEALQYINRAIALDGSQPEFYKSRSRIHNSIGDFNLALLDATRVTELQPRRQDSWLCRGRILERIGRMEQALADYSKALSMDKNYDEARVSRAALALKAKKYNLAIEDYTYIISRSSGDDEALKRRGDAWLASGNSEKAIADYSAAIKLSPNLAAYRSARAGAYKLVGKAELANADQLMANRLKAQSPK